MIALAIAVPAAHFYKSPILAFIIPLLRFRLSPKALVPSAALVEKRLQFSKQNIFKRLWP